MARNRSPRPIHSRYPDLTLSSEWTYSRVVGIVDHRGDPDRPGQKVHPSSVFVGRWTPRANALAPGETGPRWQGPDDDMVVANLDQLSRELRQLLRRARTGRREMVLPLRTRAAKRPTTTPRRRDIPL